jgi:hypothetical protein
MCVITIKNRGKGASVHFIRGDQQLTDGKGVSARHYGTRPRRNETCLPAAILFDEAT